MMVAITADMSNTQPQYSANELLPEGHYLQME